MGLAIMRTRAEKAGAAFNIESQLRRGTQITVTLDAGMKGDGHDHTETNTRTDRR
jgi:nitrate/nitrite-specific signal transduction histidine kinase